MSMMKSLFSGSRSSSSSDKHTATGILHIIIVSIFMYSKVISGIGDYYEKKIRACLADPEIHTLNADTGIYNYLLFPSLELTLSNTPSQIPPHGAIPYCLLLLQQITHSHH